MVDKSHPDRFFFAFGLRFNAITDEQAVDLVMAKVFQRQKTLVVTPNVDHIVQLQRNPAMAQAYNKAELVFADGMPLVWFSRWVGASITLPERVNGTNLVEGLVKASAPLKIRIGLLGGEPGSAEKLAATMATKYPDWKFAGWSCPPFGFEQRSDTAQAVIRTINDWQADILLVGLGAPKQEMWISNHWDALHFTVAIGIGSAIDMLAGKHKRAPVLMQRAGLEWFWRLLLEPRRLWKRYLVDDMTFLPMALREIIPAKNKNNLAPRKEFP